jgi:hypothetical protein
MEQVNLLTMMLATPAMGQTQLAQKSPVGLPGAQFELALQRQLWQSNLPVSTLGGTGTAAMTQALSVQPQATADSGPLSTLRGLLNALASSLLTVLKQDGKLAETAVQQAGVPAGMAVDTADAGVVLAGNLVAILDAGSGQGQSVTPAEDVLWANATTTGASDTQALMTKLLNLWPQLAEQLQALLQSAKGSELKVQLSWPNASQTATSATATPWSMTAMAAGQGALPSELPPGLRTGYAVQPTVEAASTNATRAKAAGDLSGAPASIRWFSQAAGAGQVTAGSADTASSAATLPATMVSTEVVLPEGLTLTVAITKVAESANGAQYNVQLSQNGAEPVALDAQLTIQRIGTVALPGVSRLSLISTQPLQALSNSGLTATPQSASVSPESLPPAGLMVQVIPSSSVLPFPRSAGVWQADAANGAVAVASPAVDYGALSINQPANVAPLLGANPQRAKVPQHSVQLSGGTLAGAAAGLDGSSMAPQVMAVESGYQPALKAVPMVTKADGQVVTSTQTVAAWSAEDALNSLAMPGKLSSPEAASIVRRLTPLASLATQASSETWQLPAVTVASGNLPVQLLQFIDAPLQVRPYAGLQYLELTQQLMEQAAQARAAGSGLYSARLDLNPPHLGQMYVNIAVHGDTVAMQLAVVSGLPKEQLRESLNALRESLVEAGLEVVELRVVTLDDQPDQQQRGQQQSGDEQPPVVKTTPSVLPTKGTPFISQLISAAPAVNFSP